MQIDWAWLREQMPLGKKNCPYIDFPTGAGACEVNMQEVCVWTWVVQANLLLAELLLTLIGPVIV